MAKIIREKYEAGILVSREVEDSGIDTLGVAKSCMQLIMAIGIAVIAALHVRDSLVYSGLAEQAGMTDSACTAPRLSS